MMDEPQNNINNQNNYEATRYNDTANTTPPAPARRFRVNDDSFQNPFFDEYAQDPNKESKNKNLNQGARNFFLVLASLLGLILLLFCVKSSIPLQNNKHSLHNFNWDIDEFLSQQIPENSKPSEVYSHKADSNAPVLQIQNLDAAGGKMEAPEIYKKLSPSIVGVVIYNLEEGVEAGQKGEGSGIVISDNGYIVTNSHVIGDSKNYGVKIVLNNNEEYSARVVGYDVRTDIAVIKADAEGLTPATFGNSDELEVGQDIIAIGNPGGLDFAGSLTMGVISALNRTLSSSSLVKYIQTDAAISPGNSGGALINMYGQVIGINTVKVVSAGYEGMGFSIPINSAKNIVEDIINQGYVSGRVRLGITGKVVSEYQSKMYNVPKGILIAQIAADSSLTNSGVEVGDIITKIDDKEVLSFDTLYGELTKHNPSDTVILTICRPASKNSQQSTFEAKVTLLEDKGETQN